MRVICIEKEWVAKSGRMDYKGLPEYGDTYNVIGETKEGVKEYYILSEYGNSYEFDKRGFIPADEPEAAVDAVNKILETVTIN